MKTNTIKWNNKKYKMPFDADYSRQKADGFKEQVIVTHTANNSQAGSASGTIFYFVADDKNGAESA